MSESMEDGESGGYELASKIQESCVVQWVATSKLVVFLKKLYFSNSALESRRVQDILEYLGGNIFMLCL